MNAASSLTKPDRYKRSSYQAFNSKLLERYDSCIWLKIFEAVRWDETILAQLGPDIASARILDVGCATGRLLLTLAEWGATRLSGFDLAPRIVEKAKAKLQSQGFDADLREADAESRIPWPDGSFDVAILTGVLHHFFRPDDAMVEIHRVVEADGRILIIDPWFRPPVRQVINLYLRRLPRDGDCRFYAPDEVRGLLERTGWSGVRQEGLSWHSYFVSATRGAQEVNHVSER
jgi:ubiquinone/menaquinone biosynthesis C-methylase UbiE